MASRRGTGNPLVDGAVQVVKEIGGKALRRAVDSVMEDGQRAAEDLRDDILDARARVAVEQNPLYDPDIRVRQVTPKTEDDMGDREQRRQRREERDRGRGEDPPPSGDIADIAEMQDMRDAEVLIRQGWMLIADLAESGAVPKETAKDLESIMNELRETIEEREGVNNDG